jgi:soluble lytic murein transglycosylase-like protein
VNIDATTIKQLLQLQLLNSMTLITSGQDDGSDASGSGEGDFAGMLQSLLGQAGGSSSGLDAATAGGGSLAALSSVLGGQAAFGSGLAGSDPFAALTGTAAFGSGSGLPLSLSGLLAAGNQPTAASGATAVRPAVLRSRYAPDPTVGKPSSYDPLIAQASSMYGVDPSLVKAVIHQESSFNPYAVSTAGAKGLMQLMDGTGEGYGVTDPFDPQQNVQAGTQFLAGLLRKYDGNEGVALAAYNAGPGRVDRLGIRTDDELAAKLRQLPQETQQYVSRVLALKDEYGGVMG